MASPTGTTGLGYFFADVLGAAGISLSGNGEQVLVGLAWSMCEGPPGSQAAYNPYNTTLPEPGATAFNWNGGDPVKNYPDWATGVRATADSMGAAMRSSLTAIGGGSARAESFANVIGYWESSSGVAPSYAANYRASLALLRQNTSKQTALYNASINAPNGPGPNPGNEGTTIGLSASPIADSAITGTVGAVQTSISTIGDLYGLIGRIATWVPKNIVRVIEGIIGIIALVLGVLILSHNSIKEVGDTVAQVAPLAAAG
jgi:hypothetical protein